MRNSFAWLVDINSYIYAQILSLITKMVLPTSLVSNGIIITCSYYLSHHSTTSKPQPYPAYTLFTSNTKTLIFLILHNIIMAIVLSYLPITCDGSTSPSHPTGFRGGNCRACDMPTSCSPRVPTHTLVPTSCSSISWQARVANQSF